MKATRPNPRQRQTKVPFGWTQVYRDYTDATGARKTKALWRCGQLQRTLDGEIRRCVFVCKKARIGSHGHLFTVPAAEDTEIDQDLRREPCDQSFNEHIMRAVAEFTGSGSISVSLGCSEVMRSFIIKIMNCAISHRERPCQKACGMDAIESDEFGKAKINYDKCVSCGMCIVSCPFGAIADKSQIFQVIQTIKSERPVYAIMAPSFVGQFGPKVNLKTIDDAMGKLGFSGVYEVSIGADLCTIEEAKDFLKEVPEKLKFMGTSCCPSWSVMAKTLYPEFKENISMALTPMVLTARLIKKEHKDAAIVFVGPCSAKKLEASRKSVRSDVDFVLTFEELMGMFVAKEVDFNTLEAKPLENITSADGRGFAVAGGVAKAVVEACKELEPNREIKVHAEQGLHNCKKMLQDAKKGVYDGYLLEGMACPFGCASGAGTITQPTKTKALVSLSQRETTMKHSLESAFEPKLDELVNE